MHKGGIALSETVLCLKPLRGPKRLDYFHVTQKVRDSHESGYPQPTSTRDEKRERWERVCLYMSCCVKYWSLATHLFLYDTDLPTWVWLKIERAEVMQVFVFKVPFAFQCHFGCLSLRHSHISKSKVLVHFRKLRGGRPADFIEVEFLSGFCVSSGILSMLNCLDENSVLKLHERVSRV